MTDSKSLSQFIDDYLSEVGRSIAALDRNVLQLMVDALLTAWREQRQVFVMGNGGSAALASHMALDINKMSSVPGQPRTRVISLSDNTGWIMALGNDISFDVVFAEQLRNLCREGDLVIAISCSGNSKNVIEALKVAKEFNCKTIGMTGDKGGRDQRHGGYLLIRGCTIDRSTRRCACGGEPRHRRSHSHDRVFGASPISLRATCRHFGCG